MSIFLILSNGLPNEIKSSPLFYEYYPGTPSWVIAPIAPPPRPSPPKESPQKPKK